METRIRINRLNPSEYFAVLGILELSQGQSRFEGEGNAVDCVIESAALPDLKWLTVTAVPFPDAFTAPVLLGDKLLLDWWLDVYREEGNGLKLWAGTCSPDAMLRNYQTLMTDTTIEKMLNFKVSTRTKSAFNLDTRASRDPLTVGFSEKEASEPSLLYPYAEFLCAIGLQNFSTRPSRGLEYYTWAHSIPVSIAHAAAVQDVPGLQSKKVTVKFKKVSQGMREVDSVTEE